MKKHVKLFIFLGLILGGVAFISYGVNADSVEVGSVDLATLTVDENGEYSLEDMLTYALIDEYTAQATYQAIIDTYGEVRPFTNIVLAEQTHIDLLLPLFETYGIEVPVNDIVVTEIPDSIASALATGVVAETANIELYQAFLAQDLPDDVATVFQTLINASTHHLAAFSKDRLAGAGYDLANGVKNGFQNMFKGTHGSRGSGSYGTGDCMVD